MNIKVSKAKANVKVVFLSKKSKTTPLGFTGKKGEIKIQHRRVVVGTNGVKDSEDWRVIGVNLVKFLKGLKVKTASINTPKSSGEFIEGLVLGDYEFTKYKSENEKGTLKSIFLTSKEKISNTVKTSIDKANSTCLTRNWVNTPPEDAHSGTIEKAVTKMFKGTDVKVTVYGEKFLTKKGMQAHLAVNRASRHEAKTIKLTYTPKKFKEHHVLIGKGLSYDSGGLSIKPGNHMTTMKADKGGAMTVWGLMDYVAKHGSKSKITVYMGIAENMIDGSAYKPDDILTAMNGKTIHVKNTDAEGRLVLADNLCLAQDQNKDITTIHTLATLTGAAIYQFGNEAAALVGFNDKLKKKVQKSGKTAGEIYMNAEFHKYMMDGVKDDVADISNTGTPNQGCQKAGLFLTNFIEKKNTKKYVHWDIAGPAFVSKPFGHNPEGGTGFGVRTLIDFVK